MTGVKEQTSRDHALLLSRAGFFALTFDAGYQGESTGEPRGLEDPHQRVEDNKAAVSFFTTVADVDADKIGVLGICASGGYTSYAAQSDARMRALATVSAACVGAMTRTGGLHPGLQENKQAIDGALKAAAEWRNAVAKQQAAVEAPQMFSVDASTYGPDDDSFFKDAAAYYGTKRGLHPRSDHKVPPSSYDLMVSYDSFGLQHLIGPRPLLMIAGADAQTLHYSQSAIATAKEPKELFVVDGKNHFDLYDQLDQSGPKLVDFFAKSLD